MDATGTEQPRFPIIASLAVLLGATLVLGGGSWLALVAMGMQGQANWAVWAAAICGGFGLLGLVPVALLDQRMQGGAAFGFLAGMLVRMAGCGAAAIIGTTRMGLPKSFGYWVAGMYLALLVVELVIVSRHVKCVADACISSTSETEECSN